MTWVEAVGDVGKGCDVGDVGKGCDVGDAVMKE